MHSRSTPGAPAHQDEDLHPIGHIAAEAEVSVATVRYYDKIGLVTAVSRVGGKRRFDNDTIGRIRFIRQAQSVGFDLDEIKLLLDDEARTWPNLVQGRILDLERRRSELDSMIETLHSISECGCTVVADCPRRF